MKPTPLSPTVFAVPRETGFPCPGCEPGSKHYKAGKMQIIVSPPSLSNVGWHMSISHPERYPSWDEIMYYRYRLCPKHITMVMYLPPLSEYVNIHEHCFHLHQEMA